MNRPTRSKANRRIRFTDPVYDKNFSLVQKAVSAIFEHSEITPNRRRITIDVQSGTWSATGLVTGRLGEAVFKERATASKRKEAKRSHKIRFEFEAGSK